MLAATGGALLIGSGIRAQRALRAFAGALLLARALRPGSSAEEGPSRLIQLQDAVTIQKPREELYTFWRDLGNLGLFLRHLHSIRMLDPLHSHWVVRLPIGRVPFDHEIRWDARITRDEPGALIAWHSLPGSEIEQAGMVRFLDAPAGRGTEVHLSLHYAPPAGALGEAMAPLLHSLTEPLLRGELRRFKQLMEAGAVTVRRHTHG